MFLILGSISSFHVNPFPTIFSNSFADLTSSDVQGWVEASMGEEAVADLKAGLDAQIEAKINPTSVTKTIG